MDHFIEVKAVANSKPSPGLVVSEAEHPVVVMRECLLPTRGFPWGLLKSNEFRSLLEVCIKVVPEFLKGSPRQIPAGNSPKMRGGENCPASVACNGLLPHIMDLPFSKLGNPSNLANVNPRASHKPVSYRGPIRWSGLHTRPQQVLVQP